jgi:hypothetical protein
MANDIEGLMLEVLHLFADRFEGRAVLKGGLELRLMDCPRFTNDMDYVFVPYKSKKEIHGPVLRALKSLPGVSVESGLHSTCFRCQIKRDVLGLQLEINVARECPSEPLSTAALARDHNTLPRVIQAMKLDVALAHKIAAWNDRRLIRDLYDAYFMFQVLHVLPDIKTLSRRLKAKPKRRIPGRTPASGVDDLMNQLTSAVAVLSQEAVEEELRYSFTPEELAGLNHKIRVGVMALVEKIG